MSNQNNYERILMEWQNLTPIERAIIIYLREGKSFDEIKDLLNYQFSLVATEILNEAVKRVETKFISGSYFKDIIRKVINYERENKRTGKKSKRT